VLDDPKLLYVALIIGVLILFRFFQGLMRNRREEKDFERTQDVVRERTQHNTATEAVDARKKGIKRRIGFRRKGNRRKKEERRGSMRRDEEAASTWDGPDQRETDRRSGVRRFLDRRDSDRRNEERRKD
jgi:hypothetical protein